MIAAIFSFLVMLNPFALFLYLKPVMGDLSDADFRSVFIKASVISFCIFLMFLLLGDLVFAQVFRIQFDSFRIFGGIVLFSFAYMFIVQGKKAFIQIKGDLHDLASEIALPFMVGAGTISLTVLMSAEMNVYLGIITLLIIMMVNFIMVMGLKQIRHRIPSKRIQKAFDKNMELLLRINGFFLGAIGIDMIITGISNLINNLTQSA